jgi:hypothetical protein
MGSGLKPLHRQKNVLFNEIDFGHLKSFDTVQRGASMMLRR